MPQPSVEDEMWREGLPEENKRRLMRLYNGKTIGEQLDEAYHRGYSIGRKNVAIVIYAMQENGNTPEEIIEHLKRAFVR